MIAVVGDTQRTLWYERAFLRREQNDRERRLILADVAAARPELLVHLGDAVAVGASRRDWRRFDELVAPVAAAGVPVLPVVGNHDLWPPWRRGTRRALGHFFARFPEAAGRRWYDRRHGPLRLVVLDTNMGRMSAEEWDGQRRWFAHVLAAADADPAARGVVVFAHHPPFTNSRATGDDANVRAAFVGPFLAARKALAFVSGHAHAYERFDRDGRAFVVAGGGGGPRIRLLAGTTRRHVDAYAGPSPRPFHYLQLWPEGDGVRWVVRGMEKGGTAVGDLDQFVTTYRG